MIDFFGLVGKKYLYLYTKRYRKNFKFSKLLKNENYLIAHSNRVKSVLLCMHSLDWGGAERFAIECAKYLYSHGIRFHIFIEKMCNNIEEFLPFVDHTNITFANNYQKSEMQLVQLISIINPNILHIHHSWSAYRALPKIDRDIYIVDTLHIIEYQTGGYPYLSAKNHRYIQLHHVTNQELSDFMHNQLGIPKYRLKLGYLTSRSSNLKPKLRKFHRDNLSIGFLGRFEKQKRPELFIECAEYILKNNEHLNIKYIMQGEGSLKKKCIEIVQKKNMEDYFIFNKPSEDIDAFHESIDILLNVSENEGLALTALESAKKRTLYISTNVGQQKEIVAINCLVSANPLMIKKEVSNVVSKVLYSNKFFYEVLREQMIKFEKCELDTAENKILEWLYV
ncbi:MAG: glycosyltransferase [Moraxella sp.]